MKILKGFAASILIHVFLFSSLYYMIIWWKNSSFSSVNIDLSGSALLLRPSRNAVRSRPIKAEPDWIISRGGKLAAIPEKTTITAAEVEPAAPPCPAPCPDNPADWSAIGAASRRPMWIDGLISEGDYPKELRAQGREGRVKVEVYIDVSGAVRDVHVMESSDPRFTAVVVDKLKKARFSPAIGKDGMPIAVHMAIPIIFELH
jgi:TonB family protein